MDAPTTRAPAEPKVRFSLRLKLGALAATLAVVPLVVIGMLLVNVNAATVETTSRELQISVIEDVARTIDGELSEAESGIDAVGRVLSDARVPEDARLSLAIALVEANGSLDHAAIYDADGELIDVIRQAQARGAPVPERLASDLRDAAASNGLGTGEVVRGDGAPRVLLVLPIEVDERLTGFTASLVSLAPVQDRVETLAGAHFSGISDSLFVVDDQLRVVAHVDPDRGHELEPASAQGILAGIDPGLLRPEFSRSGEFIGGDGISRVGTMLGLQTRPWAAVAQVPSTVAYASLIEMRRLVAFSVAGAVGLALIAGLLVAQRITSPLAQLAGLARRLAARDFGARTQINTSDELAVLGHAMSNAAADLEASETEIRQQIEVRNDLGRYLSAELVEKVVAREQDMALGGQRREITVMFADLVAFTPLTDRLSAEDVVQILNELFTITTEIIFRHDGTVDKFIGDCVMAMWGAPTAQEDHARRAVAAAEEILAWLELGNRNWNERYGITVQLAIGINTGEAIVGNIGSETRMEFTAIGDTVNVAARLESIARPQQILISGATRQAAGDVFEYGELGTRVVAGRSEPVEIYEVRT